MTGLEHAAPAKKQPVRALELTREQQDFIARLGQDMLGGWNESKVYYLQPPGSSKKYRGGQKFTTPTNLASHLFDSQTIAVGPIRRAICVDVDLPRDAVSPELKQMAAKTVEGLLAELAIPSLTFDSARGTHTWIRLERDASPAELAALDALIAAAWRHDDLPGAFEIYPKGDKAIRFPFGVYEGERRRPLTPMTDDAVFAWLLNPLRATNEHLNAVLAAAPAVPAKETVRPTTLDASPPIAALSAPPPSFEPPAPLRGWEAWPICKQMIARKGPLPGKRHDTWLMLACEATESGEDNPETIARFLLAIPRSDSETSARELRYDARKAAEGAVKLKRDHDHRRFSGCGAHPGHSGHPSPRQHRATFAHECTEEAQRSCSIHSRWQREQRLPAYQHILDSSLWRSGRGSGKGLGSNAKRVYELMLRLSGGDPARTFRASKRYVAMKLLYEGLEPRAASLIKKRLAEEELIEAIDPEHGLYKVPYRSEAWVKEKETALGTDRSARRLEREILDHWKNNERFQTTAPR